MRGWKVFFRRDSGLYMGPWKAGSIELILLCGARTHSGVFGSNADTVGMQFSQRLWGWWSDGASYQTFGSVTGKCYLMSSKRISKVFSDTSSIFSVTEEGFASGSLVSWNKPIAPPDGPHGSCGIYSSDEKTEAESALQVWGWGNQG